MNRINCRSLMSFHLLLLAGLILPIGAFGQVFPTAGFQFIDTPPPYILAARSVVLYDPSFTKAELQEIQKAFQQIGIDAVAYFETDVVFAGRDISSAYSNYFTSRQVRYIVFFEKSSTAIRFIATDFIQGATLFNAIQNAWQVQGTRLNEVLRIVFQDSWRAGKKKNFLINDFPETDITINPIKGNRQEFYAFDLKIDNLAVPKFGDPVMDKELEAFFQTNYPLKYKLTEPGTDERELIRQGFRYILCYARLRGDALREILGYDMTKSENAYASITFPNGQLQLKTIPRGTEVYKFYFRHIDNSNVFLGPKWDADVTWQDALRNHVMGFKTEMKLN